MKDVPSSVHVFRFFISFGQSKIRPALRPVFLFSRRQIMKDVPSSVHVFRFFISN